MLRLNSTWRGGVGLGAGLLLVLPLQHVLKSQLTAISRPPHRDRADVTPTNALEARRKYPLSRVSLAHQTLGVFPRVWRARLVLHILREIS